MPEDHHQTVEAARKFVEELLEEGSKVACDETNEGFNGNFGKLPEFYDEEKYNRGRKFYQRNIFALYLGKLMGLLSVLALPSVLKLLMYTNMSSNIYTAYKRYMQTIFHMVIWYEDDFKPGSKLWRSIEEVRHRHNSASKKGCTAGLSRITQKDMALTQFGFLGYAMARPKEIGIHHATKEELEGLIHIWRVVGYILGMEDRYNLCRESVEETQEICKLLIASVIKPSLDKKPPDFFKMSDALINGMWFMNPFLKTKLFLSYLYYIVCDVSERSLEKSQEFVRLNLWDRLNFWVIIKSLQLMQFNFWRTYTNFLQNLGLWLMPRFPFLAYVYLGIENSRFTILNTKSRKSG